MGGSSISWTTSEPAYVTLLDTAGLYSQAVVESIQNHDIGVGRPLLMRTPVWRASSLLLAENGWMEDEVMSVLRRKKRKHQVDFIGMMARRA